MTFSQLYYTSNYDEHIIIFQLSPLEDQFIFAAEFGDISTVKHILENNPNFSVEYHDILNRTPFRLAVGNEHLEVKCTKIEVNLEVKCTKIEVNLEVKCTKIEAKHQPFKLFNDD